MLKLRHWGLRLWSRSVCLALVAFTCLFSATWACAGVTVLVGEPFGNFGTMMPVGHTAVFIDRACADGPLKIRMCRPDEPQGVVVARYHQVGQYDWLASPVMEFLYATERPEDVLSYATIDNSWDLRQIYRRTFLRNIVPDGKEYDKATNEWWESAGTAYTRRIWGYQLATTVEQDRRFVDILNERPNRHAYKLSNNNCADFAAQMINIYFHGAVKRDKVADYGWMTPKNVARCVQAYGMAHPELDFRVLEIPQVPGSLRRSRPVRGAAEAGLKTKRYVFTLLVIQPEVPIVSWFMYMDRGRWQIGRNAQPVDPSFFDRKGEPQVAEQNSPSATSTK
jgi:hypothetical protein